MVIFEKLLINDKNSRKIFGKGEIKIIQKQIYGIELTQSEKNRLSRDIRPKFEFIKTISNFKDYFPLKKSQLINKMIKNTIQVILNDKFSDNINSILLFGSHANNTANFQSDIDVCVIFKEKLSSRQSTLFRIRVMGELNNSIDLHVFNELPKKMKLSIAKNHKVLYKKSNFDNLEFTINELKDKDYFIRYDNIFGAKI